jgi:hypothetical protein
VSQAGCGEAGEPSGAPGATCTRCSGTLQTAARSAAHSAASRLESDVSTPTTIPGDRLRIPTISFTCPTCGGRRHGSTLAQRSPASAPTTATGQAVWGASWRSRPLRAAIRRDARARHRRRLPAAGLDGAPTGGPQRLIGSVHADGHSPSPDALTGLSARRCSVGRPRPGRRTCA